MTPQTRAIAQRKHRREFPSVWRVNALAAIAGVLSLALLAACGSLADQRDPEAPGSGEQPANADALTQGPQSGPGPAGPNGTPHPEMEPTTVPTATPDEEEAPGHRLTTPAPNPTATQQPLEPDTHGDEKSPEDFRKEFEDWPDEYKISFDDGVVVQFAYPGGGGYGWVGAVFIRHIPSTSLVILDGDGEVQDKRYVTEDGRSILEAFIADGEVMDRLLEHLEEIWEQDTEPSPTPTVDPRTPTPLCIQTQGTHVEIRGERVPLSDDLCVASREGDEARISLVNDPLSYFEVNTETGFQAGGSVNTNDPETWALFEPVWGSMDPMDLWPAPTPTTTLGPRPTPAASSTPHGVRLKLSAKPADDSGYSVRFVAEVIGGPDNNRDLYCVSTRWQFGDGDGAPSAMTFGQCPAWGPDAQITRHREQTHTYEDPGTYQAIVRHGELEAETMVTLPLAGE